MKLTEMEAYLIDEIEVREKLLKKMLRFNAIIFVIDKCLTTSTVITGWVSLNEFAGGVGLPVEIALGGINLIFSCNSNITNILEKINHRARKTRCNKAAY